MSHPHRQVKYGRADTEFTRLPDGTILMRSPEPLDAYPDRLTERLLHWAEKAPDRTFMAQRTADGSWRRLSYADLLRNVRSIGQALLDRDLSAERPLAILSDNDLEHVQLALAAQYVGVPSAAISPAYALVSTDHAKLRRPAQAGSGFCGRWRALCGGHRSDSSCRRGSGGGGQPASWPSGNAVR